MLLILILIQLFLSLIPKRCCIKTDLSHLIKFRITGIAQVLIISYTEFYLYSVYLPFSISQSKCPILHRVILRAELYNTSSSCQVWFSLNLFHMITKRLKLDTEITKQVTHNRTIPNYVSLRIDKKNPPLGVILSFIPLKSRGKGVYVDPCVCAQLCAQLCTQNHAQHCLSRMFYGSTFLLEKFKCKKLTYESTNLKSLLYP